MSSIVLPQVEEGSYMIKLRSMGKNWHQECKALLLNAVLASEAECTQLGGVKGRRKLLSLWKCIYEQALKRKFGAKGAEAWMSKFKDRLDMLETEVTQREKEAAPATNGRGLQQRDLITLLPGSHNSNSARIVQSGIQLGTQNRTRHSQEARTPAHSSTAPPSTPATTAITTATEGSNTNASESPSNSNTGNVNVHNEGDSHRNDGEQRAEVNLGELGDDDLLSTSMRESLATVNNIRSTLREAKEGGNGQVNTSVLLQRLPNQLQFIEQTIRLHTTALHGVGEMCNHMMQRVEGLRDNMPQMMKEATMACNVTDAKRRDIEKRVSTHIKEEMTNVKFYNEVRGGDVRIVKLAAEAENLNLTEEGIRAHFMTNRLTAKIKREFRRRRSEKAKVIHTKCFTMLHLDGAVYPKVIIPPAEHSTNKRNKMTNEQKKAAAVMFRAVLQGLISVTNHYEVAMAIAPHLADQQTVSDAAFAATVVNYLLQGKLFEDSCNAIGVPNLYTQYHADFMEVYGADGVVVPVGDMPVIATPHMLLAQQAAAIAAQEAAQGEDNILDRMEDDE